MQKTSMKIIAGPPWTNLRYEYDFFFSRYVYQKIEVQLETLFLAIDLGFETSPRIHQAIAELQSLVWPHFKT